MTWIKPSFQWMMYRSGWATKAGQEHVLAIEMTCDGFDWALAHPCLSHDDREHYPDRPTWKRLPKTCPVRIQWDPEWPLQLGALPYRSLQVGLSGEAVDRYLDSWLVAITDVTPTVHIIRRLVQSGDEACVATLPPDGRPYPLSPEVAAIIGCTDATASTS